LRLGCPFEPDPARGTGVGMKFIVDAQLPRRLADALAGAGHEAIHSSELSLGNRTPDEDIVALAGKEGCVVVTKDSDFVNSFLLHHTPPKLLLVSTGNISNDQLLRLFRSNLSTLENVLEKHNFVEINASIMVIHC
jgi:predicted nuclease of predicted toxin-antitoxin system